MLILDSDHLRVLRSPGPLSEKLENRLIRSGRAVVTTIINVQEGLKGYLSEINNVSKSRDKARAYVDSFANLQTLMEYYCNWNVIPFDVAAAETFLQLRSNSDLRIVGTADLQIAAIALCRDAIVLTRNTQHFSRVPGLSFEDWIADEQT